MWLIMIAGPSTQLPIRSLERIFIGTCLLANVIIIGPFQVNAFALQPKQLFETFVIGIFNYFIQY